MNKLLVLKSIRSKNKVIKKKRCLLKHTVRQYCVLFSSSYLNTGIYFKVEVIGENLIGRKNFALFIYLSSFISFFDSVGRERLISKNEIFNILLFICHTCFLCIIRFEISKFEFLFFVNIKVHCLVLSIKCYVCKEPDHKCRDPFQNDTIFLKDCVQIGMGNATMCRKYMWESKKKKKKRSNYLYLIFYFKLVMEHDIICVDVLYMVV